MPQYQHRAVDCTLFPMRLLLLPLFIHTATTYAYIRNCLPILVRTHRIHSHRVTFIIYMRWHVNETYEGKWENWSTHHRSILHWGRLQWKSFNVCVCVWYFQCSIHRKHQWGVSIKRILSKQSNHNWLLYCWLGCCSCGKGMSLTIEGGECCSSGTSGKDANLTERQCMCLYLCVLWACIIN